MATVGDKIREIRMRKGITQGELATMLNISDKTVSSWEINRTEPKMGMIEKICEVLHCQKTELIPGFKVTEPEKQAAEHYRLISLYEMLSESEKESIIRLLEKLTK